MNTAIFGKQLSTVQRTEAWKSNVIPTQLNTSEKVFNLHGINQLPLEQDFRPKTRVPAVGKAEEEGLKPGKLYFDGLFAELVKKTTETSYRFVLDSLSLWHLNLLRPFLTYVSFYFFSSGSEHASEFLEIDDIFGNAPKPAKSACKCDKNCGQFGCPNEDSDGFFDDDTVEMMKAVSRPHGAIQSRILELVSATLSTRDPEVETVSSWDSEPGETVKSLLRRKVMIELKKKGFNAAICKSRWEHTKNSPGGAYEYVDIFLGKTEDSKERIIVDIFFQEQFVIARPSSDYESLVKAIPAIYVGRVDKVRQIVEVMTEAMKQSVKLSGLAIPPWRKSDYLLSKWFSSHKRTSNDVSGSSFRLSNDIFSPNYNKLPPMEIGKADWDLPAVNFDTKLNPKGGLSLAFGN